MSSKKRAVSLSEEKLTTVLCRHEATPQMWQEVYLSALLRAILYADDANYVRCAGRTSLTVYR